MEFLEPTEKNEARFGLFEMTEPREPRANENGLGIPLVGEGGWRGIGANARGNTPDWRWKSMMSWGLRLLKNS